MSDAIVKLRLAHVDCRSSKYSGDRRREQLGRDRAPPPLGDGAGEVVREARVGRDAAPRGILHRLVGPRRARGLGELASLGGVVERERAVDLLVGCRAERCAGDDELPAQVEVDVESWELDRAVEQAAEHVGVRLRRGDPRERLHELQLRVGAGLGELGERPHGVAGLGGDPLAVVVGEVAADGELEPGEGEAARRGLGLVADAARARGARTRSRASSASRTASHADPSTTARATGSASSASRATAVANERCVEPHLRVGEVVVVHEQQVGLRQADEVGHVGRRAVDVELDAVRAHERTRARRRCSSRSRRDAVAGSDATGRPPARRAPR